MSETGEHANMRSNMHRHGIYYRDRDVVSTIADEYIARCGSVDGWEAEGSCSDEDRRQIAEMLDEVGRSEELVDAVCGAIMETVRSRYEDDLELARSVYVASRTSMTVAEACKIIARHKELPPTHWLRSASTNGGAA